MSLADHCPFIFSIASNPKAKVISDLFFGMAGVVFIWSLLFWKMRTKAHATVEGVCCCNFEVVVLAILTTKKGKKKGILKKEIASRADHFKTLLDVHMSVNHDYHIWEPDKKKLVTTGWLLIANVFCGWFEAP